jgi:hypothetical protein
MSGHLVLHQSLLCILIFLSLFAEEQIVLYCGSENDSNLTNSIKAGPELLHVLENQDSPYA